MIQSFLTSKMIKNFFDHKIDSVIDVKHSCHMTFSVLNICFQLLALSIFYQQTCSMFFLMIPFFFLAVCSCPRMYAIT